MCDVKQKPLETYCVDDSDLMLVSKFSKYDAHLVVANDELIVYTSSKLSIIRVVLQHSSKHYSFDAEVNGRISDLILSEFSDPSRSLLTVASRDTGIFSFWILRHDDSGLPAVLTRKITEVPSEVKFTIYKKNDAHVAFAWKNNIDIVTISDNREAIAAAATGASMTDDENSYRGKTSKRGALIESFSRLQYLRFQFSDHNIESFAISTKFKSIAAFFSESPGSSYTGPAFDIVSIPSLDDRVTLPAQRIRIDRNRESTLNATVDIPNGCSINFFSRPNSPSEYVLIGYENNSVLSLMSVHNTFTFFPIDLRSELSESSLSSVYFDKTLLVAMVVSNDKSKIILILFEFPTDKDVSVRLLKVVLPRDLNVLDCAIFHSLEPENYINKDVVDLYIYHSRGIAIAPVIIRDWESEFKQVSNSVTPENLAPKSEQLLLACVDRFVENNQYERGDEHAQFLKDFFSKSDFLEVFTEIVAQRLGKESTNKPTPPKELSEPLNEKFIEKDKEDKKEITEESDSEEPNGQHIPPDLINSLEEASSSEPRTELGPEKQASFIPPPPGLSSQSNSIAFSNAFTSPFSSPGFDGMSHTLPKKPNTTFDTVQKPTQMQQPTPHNALYQDLRSGFVSPPISSSITSPVPLQKGISRLSIGGTTLGQSNGYSSQIWGSVGAYPGSISSNLTSYRQPSFTQQQQKPQSQLPPSLSQTESLSSEPFRSLVSPPLNQPSFTPQKQVPSVTATSFVTASPSVAATSSQQLPYPQCEIDTPFPELPIVGDTLQESLPPAPSTQSKYLIIDPPRSDEISARERGIIRSIIQQDPLGAFHYFRSPEETNGTNKTANRPIDLGRLLSCAMYITTATGGSHGNDNAAIIEQKLLEDNDSKNSNADTPFIISADMWTEPLSVTLPELMKWAHRTFGPRFFLILGYVACLVSPALNAPSPDTSVEDQRQSLTERIKWAVALLSVVNSLVSLSNINSDSGYADKNDGEDYDIPNNGENAEVARAQWTDSKELVAPTLTQIRNDVLSIMNSEPAKTLSSIISDLLEIITNLME